MFLILVSSSINEYIQDSVSRMNVSASLEIFSNLLFAGLEFLLKIFCMLLKSVLHDTSRYDGVVQT